MESELTQKFQQIKELLKKAETLLIASHESPDPDAVGSVLALRYALKNPKPLCYLPNPSPKNLNFLPGFFEIKNEIPQEFLSPDIIFGLDYGDFKRLKLPNVVSAKTFITVDHHRGDQRGEIQIIEPGFSSTAEIIYYFLKEIGIEIDKGIATCLLTGIIADSGGFAHISTSSRTMRVASQLLLAGAPLTKIARGLSCPYFPQIWGRALSRIRSDKRTGLAYSWLTLEDLKEYQASLLDLAGISSLISTASSANMSLFLVEYEKGKVKGSLRSEPFKGKSVVALAEVLGGGGHLYAAGFKQEGTIPEVLKKVLNLIE